MWAKHLLVFTDILCKKCKHSSCTSGNRISPIINATNGSKLQRVLKVSNYSNLARENHKQLKNSSKNVRTNSFREHKHPLKGGSYNFTQLPYIYTMGKRKMTELEQNLTKSLNNFHISLTESEMPLLARALNTYRRYEFKKISAETLPNLVTDLREIINIRKNSLCRTQPHRLSNISHIHPLCTDVKTFDTVITRKFCTKSTEMERGSESFKNNSIHSHTQYLSENNLDSVGKVEKIDGVVEAILKKTKTDIMQLFPQPKNTLGNIYQVVAKEKNSSEYKLSPSYRKANQQWVCSYKIKWPEDKTFTVSSLTKKQASTNCCWEVLKYLLETKTINEKGTPKLYTKEDVQKLKGNIPILQFQGSHIEKLSEIVDLHVNKIFPMINQPNEDKVDDEFLEKEDEKVRVFHQKYLGYNRYKCKEELKLPVSDFKSQIVQLVEENRVVIVKGEPGCGKSTRIPQYILEGWAEEAEATGEPCRIVITEPRRIAAVSLAERVAEERREEVGAIVGYQVRMKSNFNLRTGRILYCTNGILLQSFKSDPNLSKFTHVIIDEAHERDINTDLLLNMLRRVLENNPNMKVIIMSATIDTGLFQNYFEGSKLIHIPGFTYPVKSHFLDNCKLNLEKTMAMCSESKPTVVHDEVAKVIMHLHKKKPEGSILCFLPGWEDIKKVRNLISDREDLSVLCLHSRLEDKEQWKIFTKAPPGMRKIILATNIAESSVTINDVSYVVDTGIHKETNLDVDKGVMSIDNHWVSQSSVDQRKGRAGRVKSGECFHLYTRQKMLEFPKFSIPEVLRASLTKVVLDSKAYIPNMSAIEFFSKLPSPPGLETVELAIKELKDLELIDHEEKLTNLGEVLVDFQLEPKLAKAMVNSVIYKCVTPIVDIVTLFSSGSELFASGLDMKEKIRSLKASFSKTSDHLALMRIFEIWDDFRTEGNRGKMAQFCEDLMVVPSRINFMRALREIHSSYLTDGLNCSVLPISDDFSDEDEIVKAVLFSGIGTFLSTKNWDIVNGRLKKNNSLVTRLNHKATITPESVNFKTTSLKSQFLVYLNETRSSARRTTLIRETSLIPAITLLLFSNQKVLIRLIDKDRYSKSLKSEEQVIVSLPGTKVDFLMDRKQATTILQCKLALSSCYDYYVYHLTKGGDVNTEMNDLWDQVLVKLSNFLKEFKTD